MSPRTKRQVVAVALFALVALLFVIAFRLAVVKGDSMLPTYRDGQIVLVNRWIGISGPLERGDVVLVNTASDVLIKRIAYLPGDEIPFPESRAFRRVRDFFEVERRRGVPEEVLPLKVPAGFVVVLGDNRAASEDSRQLGPIAFKDVLGRVVGAPRR